MRVCSPKQRDGGFERSKNTLQFKIRQFAFGDAPRMVEIQEACLEICKDTAAFTAGFFYEPCFESGDNIFCAVDVAGEIIGYVAVCQRTVSVAYDGVAEIWLDLRVDPEFSEAVAARDQLLAKAVERAYEIAATLPADCVALVASYFASGRASLDYLMSKGFALRARTYTLQRDLSMPFSPIPVSQGVEVYPWRMDSEVGQRDYLAAYAAATGDRRWDLDALQRFIKSEFWAVGTTIAAFYNGEIIGSALVWYDPNLMRNKQLTGRIERIFVRPDWRGRGIIQRLLNEGAAYLRRRGMSSVTLMVVDGDQLVPAIYEGLGYRVVEEEVTLGLLLD